MIICRSYRSWRCNRAPRLVIFFLSTGRDCIEFAIEAGSPICITRCAFYDRSYSSEDDYTRCEQAVVTNSASRAYLQQLVIRGMKDIFNIYCDISRVCRLWLLGCEKEGED